MTASKQIKFSHLNTTERPMKEANWWRPQKPELKKPTPSVVCAQEPQKKTDLSRVDSHFASLPCLSENER